LSREKNLKNPEFQTYGQSPLCEEAPVGVAQQQDQLQKHLSIEKKHVAGEVN
jgi:hypothetical protein